MNSPMTTAPTNEMLALADELDAKLPVFHGRERDLIVRVVTALRLDAAAPAEGGGDLVSYFKRQIEWSRQTFGPALRTKGVIDHIRKELREIEDSPHDLSEWVDVIILAMDGFWRHGGEASNLLPALLAKQQKNMARVWPDWRSMSEDSAIEHDRTKDAAPPLQAQADSDAVREALARAYLTGRGMEQSSIDDVSEFNGETWQNAIEAIAGFVPAALTAPAENARDGKATENVGRWLAAALDDPQVCQEMKNDILAWMEAGKPNVQPAATPTPPSADVAELARLKQGIRDIAQACVDGRVCDDVAWFTAIPAETLFDKCCNLLDEDLPTIQSAAPGGGTKSDGACLSSLPSGESELLVTAARAPSDPAQEPSVTTFGGSSPCFGRPGDARNTYVDAQEPDAVAYLHRHRKFGRDLQFTQLEACDREQGWTEQPLYRTRPVSLDREAVLDELSYILEGIILRRLREDKIAGYVFETAKEQTDAILALIEGMT
jgi:hypothetical protein